MSKIYSLSLMFKLWMYGLFYLCVWVDFVDATRERVLYNEKSFGMCVLLVTEFGCIEVLHGTHSHSFQRPFGHTINKQADKRNTQRLEIGLRGRRGMGKTEECLGMNGKQLFMRVYCILEEPHSENTGVTSYYTKHFYNRPCHFCNGLIRLSSILWG